MPNQRREFIKKVVATGTVAGIAGCGSQGDGGDGGGGGGQQDGDATPEPDVEYEEVEPVAWLTLSREDSPDYYEEAQQAQRMLQALGFTFDQTVYEAGQWVETLFAKDYDMANIGWSNTVERLFPYYNLYFSFHSQYTGEGGGNFSEFESDEYDNAVENFAQSMELEDRQEWANVCQDILATNVPVAYMTNPPVFVAHNHDLYSGWDTMLGTYAYFNPTTLKTGVSEQGGDTVVLGTVSPPEQYPNFMSHTGPAAVFLHKLNYDPIVQMDTQGNPIPEGAAEDWEIVDDTTIDVTLRDGMTWHDGEPVTPEDVKFTWDYVTEHGVPYIASDIEPYESSELRGDRSIRFNLSHPFAGFIPVSFYRVPILPQHVWDGITEEEELEHPGQWQSPDMTGSGPFQMVNYEPGNRVVFEKHQDHYAADEYDFDSIVYRIFGTNTSAVGALINGDVTFVQNVGYSDWTRAQEAESTTAVNNPSIRVNGIFINNNRAPFNDVRVRQAVAWAIDRQAIIDTVHQGFGEPATSPVAPANERYYNADVEGYPIDVQRGRALLQEAGFRYDGDTLLQPVDWEPEVEFISVEN